MVGEERGCGYTSFDDDAVRRAARSDPAGFVASLPAKSILDEVQRVPEVFTALELAIDRRSVAGRLVLTGSANVLLVPSLEDSLAGPVAILRLHPLSQCELGGVRPRFLDKLFGSRFRVGVSQPLGGDLYRRIVDGGHPAALSRQAPGTAISWTARSSETSAI